jgi:hypothetical protein
MTHQNPHEILDHLTPDDALAVLQALARDDPQIAARAAEIALQRVSGVDYENVAYDLDTALNMLAVEEVWDRAGPNRSGYVDTTEAADQMFEDVMTPYLDELKRLVALNMTLQANEMCKGLLLGLYLFDHESNSEFKDWAPDSASIFAQWVIDAWKAGATSPQDVQRIKAFIEEHLGGLGAAYL